MSDPISISKITIGWPDNPDNKPIECSGKTAQLQGKKIVLSDITLDVVSERFFKFLPEKYLNKKYIQLNLTQEQEDGSRREFSVHVKASQVAEELGIKPHEARQKLFKVLTESSELEGNTKKIQNQMKVIADKFVELQKPPTMSREKDRYLLNAGLHSYTEFHMREGEDISRQREVLSQGNALIEKMNTLARKLELEELRNKIKLNNEILIKLNAPNKVHKLKDLEVDLSQEKFKSLSIEEEYQIIINMQEAEIESINNKEIESLISSINENNNILEKLSYKGLLIQNPSNIDKEKDKTILFNKQQAKITELKEIVSNQNKEITPRLKKLNNLRDQIEKNNALLIKFGQVLFVEKLTDLNSDIEKLKDLDSLYEGIISGQLDGIIKAFLAKINEKRADLLLTSYAGDLTKPIAILSQQPDEDLSSFIDRKNQKIVEYKEFITAQEQELAKPQRKIELLESLVTKINENRADLRRTSYEDIELIVTAEMITEEEGEDEATFFSRLDQKIAEYKKLITDQKHELDKPDRIEELATAITDDTMNQILQTHTLDIAKGTLRRINAEPQEKEISKAELEKTIKVAALTFLKTPNTSEVHEGVFSTVMTKNRRLSVLSREPVGDLGKGSFGAVTAVVSLTQGIIVALKRNIGGKIESHTKEIANTERFERELIPRQEEILPGGPPISIVRIHHKFDHLGSGEFTMAKYDMDLAKWVGKHGIKDRITIAPQIFYWGAFCEQVGFTNFDTKFENILIKKTQLAFADLGGGFFADDPKLDTHRLGVWNPSLVPEYDATIIENTNIKDNKIYREKLGVFQIGNAIFRLLTNDFPFEFNIAKMPVIGAAPNILEAYKETLLSDALKASGKSDKTVAEVIYLIKRMLHPNPLDRISCLEAYRKFDSLMKNGASDPIETYKNDPKFQGNMNEDGAEAVLKNKPNGTWLLRYDTNQNIYVVSRNENGIIMGHAWQPTPEFLEKIKLDFGASLMLDRADPFETYKDAPNFHGEMGIGAAEELLENQPNGTWILRYDTQTNKYIISRNNDGEIEHRPLHDFVSFENLKQNYGGDSILLGFSSYRNDPNFMGAMNVKEIEETLKNKNDSSWILTYDVKLNSYFISQIQKGKVDHFILKTYISFEQIKHDFGASLMVGLVSYMDAPNFHGQLSENEANDRLKDAISGTWLLRYDVISHSYRISQKTDNGVNHLFSPNFIPLERIQQYFGPSLLVGYSSYRSDPNFCGDISQEAANTLLGNKPNGSWLLRYSAHDHKFYLSNKNDNGEIMHGTLDSFVPLDIIKKDLGSSLMVGPQS